VTDSTRRNATAILLNGGASTRLGRDKATLRVRGHTMLERAIDVLAAVVDEILVVGRPEACPPHPAVTRAIADAVGRTGPLGGIYTGLMAMSRPYGFVVACDMPCLDAEVIRRQLALAPRADAVVPTWDGYWEPLHAVYSQDCLPAARRQLESGDLRIRSFYGAVDVLFWDVVADGIGTRPFTNVNTKADLAALLREPG
jgi:molybdopterin-guanine dinucleotide biosynthesis protein A